MGAMKLLVIIIYSITVESWEQSISFHDIHLIKSI